ncbi:NAD-dependent epimerase/dehydratase family protein [Coprobacillaceae bacterium CR2/5/TPMF4]|nr:NAD-dependent epimerase/dehydratase family protein [Coprobacillaceae bacterium CR2/5/TPMF4]
MKILVTGANGFVGKNLVSTLKNIKDGKDQTRNINIQDIYTYDIENTIDDLKEYAKDCDFVFHLAGVNRPKNIEEFYEGNTNFTELLCASLELIIIIVQFLSVHLFRQRKVMIMEKAKRRGTDFNQTCNE